MQLRRAVEIVNCKESKANTVVYYNNTPVHIESVDTNIGTACVTALDCSSRFEVDLEQLAERK